jgi:catechol 2,3-dioxygenase-like lactoylglutathione lyase family enzyme
MLEDSDVVATIPAQDLERAKSFYADKLGLKPAEERPEGVYYRCGEGRFLLFLSSGTASGSTNISLGRRGTDLARRTSL